MTPFQQRMSEALQRRGLSARTQERYVRAVQQRAEHDHKSPEHSTAEALRQYLLHLQHVTHSSRRATTIARSGITCVYAYPLTREGSP